MGSLSIHKIRVFQKTPMSQFSHIALARWTVLAFGCENTTVPHSMQHGFEKVDSVKFSSELQRWKKYVPIICPIAKQDVKTINRVNENGIEAYHKNNIKKTCFSSMQLIENIFKYIYIYPLKNYKSVCHLAFKTLPGHISLKTLYPNITKKTLPIKILLLM